MKSKLISCGFLALTILLVGCSHDTESYEANTSGAPQTIRLITYGSFEISDEVFDDFFVRENIKVEILKANSVGEMLATLVLTKDRPAFDVVFGIDNTFVHRALEEDLFVQYASPALSNVSQEFQINDFVTPVDYGDVCVNYWLESFGGTQNLPATPTNLDDLIDPAYKNQFVTQHPETSSPGLAFLLATIAKYGEDENDGWKSYWRQLKENGVSVRSSWSDAYYSEFLPNGGERSIVTSYASSPVAEVYYGDLAESPTGVITDGCFRQVEYAGILAGAQNMPAAQKVIDLFLSQPFQEDISLNMFVYPVSSQAALPEVFVQNAPVIENPLTISAEKIAEMRDEWTQEWVRILFR